MDSSVIIGLLIPFLGTTLGAGCVFFMRQSMNRLVEKILLGLLLESWLLLQSGHC